MTSHIEQMNTKVEETIARLKNNEYITKDGRYMVGTRFDGLKVVRNPLTVRDYDPADNIVLSSETVEELASLGNLLEAKYDKERAEFTAREAVRSLTDEDRKQLQAFEGI